MQRDNSGDNSKDISLSEIIEKQNAIIRLQADIIDSIFVLLMQYINLEDIESLACIDDIQKVSALYQEIDIK